MNDYAELMSKQLEKKFGQLEDIQDYDHEQGNQTNSAEQKDNAVQGDQKIKHSFSQKRYSSVPKQSFKMVDKT